MRSDHRAGCFDVTAAAYNAKHCTQVAKSGITLRECIKSEAWTISIWPSNDCGTERALPLAGGSSAKSTYSPAKALSSIFLGIAGRPAPSETNADAFTAVDSGTTRVLAPARACDTLACGWSTPVSAP